MQILTESIRKTIYHPHQHGDMTTLSVITMQFVQSFLYMYKPVSQKATKYFYSSFSS